MAESMKETGLKTRNKVKANTSGRTARHMMVCSKTMTAMASANCFIRTARDSKATGAKEKNTEAEDMCSLMEVSIK